MAARNGSASRPLSIARHATNATSAVTAGIHHKNKMFGSENHRAAMRSKASGVHRLTIAMKASTTTSSTLAEGSKHGAGGKRERPMRLAAYAEPAELECDAAKDQRQQHDDDRQIERRQNDRIRQRESDHQSGAAEHEPGLIAVPERRDGIHHLVALVLAFGERKQDADAEVESVEDHVHR